MNQEYIEYTSSTSMKCKAKSRLSGWSNRREHNGLKKEQQTQETVLFFLHLTSVSHFNFQKRVVAQFTEPVRGNVMICSCIATVYTSLAR